MLLAGVVNVLTATLALVGNLFYVLVYTRWLKRTTPQNIVIGGAAGAVPPLVGWAAATGNLTLPALFLFLIVFFWTPPHFWALALLIKRDYAAAGIPMLPVVRGDRETVRQIVLYSFVLVGVTVVPFLSGRSGASTSSRRSRSARGSSGSRSRLRREHDAAPRGAPLPLLAPLPGAGLRGGAVDVVVLMLDPETERKNMLLGWGLFVLFCLIAAGTVAIAFIYLAVD